jgi:signal transduction histidine kinase
MRRLPSLLAHPWALVVASFVLVTLVGYFVDSLLVASGVSRWHTILFSNALDGFIAAWFLLSWQQQHRREMELMQQRMEIVGEMNHHVRNALQVISFFARDAKDSESAERLRESIDRIQWALREVLPKYGGAESASSRPLN